MRTIFYGLAALGALTSIVACDDTPPDPAGNLRRPSGLALIVRAPDEQAQAYKDRTNNRFDLAVADAEAQGVRVLQRQNFFGAVGDSDDGWLDRFPLREFIPAPVPFFNLTIPAEGFPTRLAPTLDSAPEHVYALAPVRGQLHLLEVAQLPFQSSANSNTNLHLKAVELSGLLPDAGVAIDLEVVRSDKDGAEDVLAVLFQGYGNVSAQVALISVNRGQGAADAQLLATTDVGAGPLDLLVQAKRPIFSQATDTSTIWTQPKSLLVSSAENSVFQLFLENTGRAFTGTATIGVGGPSGNLIDAEENGVLVVRTDRSSVVHLLREGDNLVRSSEVLRSPFADTSERLASIPPGRLDLRIRSQVVNGSYGRVTSLTDTFTGFGGATTQLENVANPYLEGSTVFDANKTLPVVALVYQDGFGGFVYFDESTGQPQVATEFTKSQIKSIQNLAGGDVFTEEKEQPLLSTGTLSGHTDSSRPLLQFKDCLRVPRRREFDNTGLTATGDWLESVCTEASFDDILIDDFFNIYEGDGSDVSRECPVVGDVEEDVTFRIQAGGALAKGALHDIRVESIGGGAERYTISVLDREDGFANSQLVAGDSFEAILETFCPEADGSDFRSLTRLTGAFESVSTDGSHSYLQALTSSTGLGTPVKVNSGDQTNCSGGDSVQLKRLASWYVFAGKDEVVVSEVGVSIPELPGVAPYEDVVRVEKRLPLPATDEDLALSQATDSLDRNRLVGMVLDADSVKALRGCAASNSEAPLCSVDADCPEGRTCATTAGGCQKRCSNCAADTNNGGSNESCRVSNIAPSCTGVQFVLSGRRALERDLRNAGQLGINRTQASVPDDIIFNPLRQSWIVSYPGSRNLVEMLATTKDALITIK